MWSHIEIVVPYRDIPRPSFFFLGDVDSSLVGEIEFVDNELNGKGRGGVDSVG